MTDVRELQSFILLGIALQMTDDEKYAKLWFFVAASIDKWNTTSAKIRVLHHIH